MTRAPALVTLLVAAAAPAALPAQADPRLVAIVRQSQEGAGDSARAELGRLLASTPATDAVYPEVLFVAAVIAPTAQEMQRNLQRITVEHALSPWADDALLKLAQLEYAGGNLPGSARNLERLRSDYPSSSLIGVAAFWAARTYFDMRQQQTACDWVRHGLDRADAGATDARGQLQFFAQRCPALRARPVPADRAGPPVDTIRLAVEPAPLDSARRDSVPRDSTPRAPVAVTPPAPAPAAAPVQPGGPRMVRIQVLAAGTQVMADDAVRRLRAMNIESRIVSEGGLLKVRAGAYATRAQAQAALPRVRTEFPGAFPVMDP